MTYRIQGILKLPDGTPAANCEIEFVSRRNFSPLVQGAKTNILTSADGAYDVTLEFGEYAVILYTGGTYPAQAGVISVLADTTTGFDLPTLLGRGEWQPAIPDYIKQIEAWLVSAGENAAEVEASADAAEASAQAAAASNAQTAGAIAAHEAKAGAHSIAGVSGLQQALDSKESSGSAASAVSAHEAKAGAHAISGITGLQEALDSKENSGAAQEAASEAVTAHKAESNAHIIENITGLRGELDSLAGGSGSSGVVSREALRRSYSESGFTLVDGSFEEGGILASASDALLHKVGGVAYSWSGAFPPGGYVVAPGSTPTPLGSGGWVDRSEVVLRGELASADGISIIGSTNYSGIKAYAGDGDKIYCIGRSNVFDHGNGLFARDDSDTTSTEIYGYLFIDALNRRWKRVHSGSHSLYWYGGTDDAATAFDNFFNYVKTLQSPGYSENGQRIRKIAIDLCGDLWWTSRPITPPPLTSGISWNNGQIAAKSGFSGGDFLIDLDDASGMRVHHYHIFNDLILDGQFLASCMRVNRYLRIGIQNVHFVQWKANGHGLLDGTYWSEGQARSEGHELSLGPNCTFQQLSFEKRYAGQIATGTAIEKNTADGQYDGFVVSSAGRGLVVNRTLNRLANFHIYGIDEPGYGVYYASIINGTYCQITNGYLDGCSFRMVNPNLGEVSHCTLLGATPIIFESRSASFQIGSKFTISNNIYNCQTSGAFVEITFAELGGTWASDYQAFQHYGCQYYTFGTAETWPDYVATTAGNVLIKDVSGALSLDLTKWMKQVGKNNASWPVAFFKVIANWQSSSGNGFGIYTVAVMRNPSATGFVAKVVGFDGTGLQTGFDVAPAVSAAGLLTATGTQYYRLSVVRDDNRIMM